MAPSPTVNPSAMRLPSDVLAGAVASVAPVRSAGQAVRRDDAAAPATLAADAADTVEAGAAIGELVDALKTTSIALRFEIDDTTHRVITKVIDRETGELIRQMPTEEVLRVARAIDKLQGLFVSQAA
ncbi:MULTISPECIES: flagellar protein FlaG [Cupriavidus]|uniref:flagellar protein FlaG n=1 Tax=Cupriavidus sp. DF5525 TaxID=3160989 RepID=UPI0003B06AE1|nr:hypothetical protein N234_33330 [Ralstonia pickettii DTP0602]